MALPPLDSLIPGAIGLGLCGGAAIGCGRLALLGTLARRWPQAQGEITHCGVRRVRNRRSGTAVRTVVEYRFLVDGRAVTGRRIFFGDLVEAWLGVPEDRRRALDVGTRVTVWHHPTRPELCALEPRVDARVWVLLAAGAGLALLILRELLAGE